MAVVLFMRKNQQSEIKVHKFIDDVVIDVSDTLDWPLNDLQDASDLFLEWGKRGLEKLPCEDEFSCVDVYGGFPVPLRAAMTLQQANVDDVYSDELVWFRLYEQHGDEWLLTMEVPFWTEHFRSGKEG